MNYIIIVILALTLTFVRSEENPEPFRVDLLVVTPPPRDLPNDPAIILDTLFEKIQLESPLKPSETLELLRRLIEEHKDAIAANELEQVVYLYSFSQLDKSKCNYDSLDKLEKVLAANKKLKASISPYLKYYKEQLWDDVCRRILQDQVANIVNNYDKANMRDLYLLTNINLDDKQDLWWSFAENVAIFIRYKLGNGKLDLNKLRDEEKFLEIYKDTIGSVCEQPMKDLEPMMRIYDLLFPESGDEMEGKSAKQKADYLTKGVDDGLTMWWISNIRICRELVENDSQLISLDAQYILTGPESIGYKIKNFFSGLFRPKNKT